MADVPTFQLGKSRYNLETFLGRFKHNMDIIDPSTLFVSEAKLTESIQLLDAFKQGTLAKDTPHTQLWQAQKIKQSTLHPDTGEKIPMPFRMSGYVPFNSPILAGLLMPGPTIPQLIFWQWLNQSHNACVNYANRNASKPTNMKTFITGYAGAVGSAISISVGLNLALKRMTGLAPTVKALVSRFVPLPAVMTASTLNVVLMRMHELDEGIEVLDKEGEVVGTSKVAAKKALQEMAVTRACLPMPLLTLPPLIMSALEKTTMLKKNPRLNVPANILVCSVCFFFALPATIAIFPQLSEVQVNELESSIREKVKDKYVYYNKGL